MPATIIDAQKSRMFGYQFRVTDPSLIGKTLTIRKLVPKLTNPKTGQSATVIQSEITAQAGTLRSAMPQMLNTPEMRFQVDESRKFAAIDEVKARLSGTDAEVNDTDGVRVTTPDGWWLLRASNTQDVLVARAESFTQDGLDRLLAQIDEQLAASGLERGPQAGH